MADLLQVKYLIPKNYLSEGVVNQEVLWKALKSFGIQEVEESSSDHFWSIVLPTGWALQAHSLIGWNAIVDDQRRARVLIYESDNVVGSGLRIVPRYEIISLESVRKLVIQDNAENDYIFEEVWGESQTKGQAMHKCAEWLTRTYPDWNVWGSYWEGV